jgi:AraC family transcriptional regulator
VERSLEYMHQQIARSDVSLDDVAEAAGLSIHHFGRVFREAMQQSPMGYLRQIRIEHAKNLMRDTRLRVSEVAHEAGFVDPLHFSRVFRKIAGQSPSEFRKG